MRLLVPFLCRSMLAASLLLLACGQAGAHFWRLEPIPLNRLLRSAERFLKRRPDDPNAHYTLARIHYLAFHLDSERIPAYRHDENSDEAPPVAPRWRDNFTVPDTKAVTLTEQDLLTHARLAIDEFHITLSLDANNALAQLGIASLEEEFLNWSKHRTIKRLPLEFVGITPAIIRSAYAKSMQLAMPEDAKIQQRPSAPLESIVSYEAATALVRLAANATQPLTDRERNDVRQAEVALGQFNALPRGAVTPVVFSFQQVDHLNRLLASKTLVDFDLRGFGPQERYPWVKPQLGILVWDPTHTGQIRSARQLFGGYTFQIFRNNGYDALAALDGDGDGFLSGDELDGISVWFDRNSDGIATPDEVVPVRDLGIARIAVTVAGHDGIHPTNSHGITMRDGRTLRTWDWIAAPLDRVTVAADR